MTLNSQKVEQYPPADPIENPRWETLEDKVENTAVQITKLLEWLQKKEHFFNAVKTLKSQRKLHHVLNVVSSYASKYINYCDHFLNIKVKPYFIHAGNYDQEAIYDHARHILKILTFLQKKITHKMMKCQSKLDELFFINKSLIIELEKIIQ